MEEESRDGGEVGSLPEVVKRRRESLALVRRPLTVSTPARRDVSPGPVTRLHPSTAQRRSGSGCWLCDVFLSILFYFIYLF